MVHATTCAAHVRGMPPTQTLPPTTDTPTEPAQVRLKAADRADCCGTQALVEITTDSGELLLCGHHFRRHESAIAAAGYDVHDERHKLNVRPSVSANAL